jgi:hypothetical protein
MVRSTLAPGSVPRYQVGIVLMTPLFPLVPLLVRVFPFLFTTSEILSRAMLRVVEGQADQFIVESADINRVGAPA